MTAVTNISTSTTFVTPLTTFPVNPTYTTFITSTPSTAASDATVGTNAWLNPENITTTDDLGSTTDLNGISRYLRASNYGFTFPSDVTILGIELVIIRKVTNIIAGDIEYDINYDQYVRITKADGTIGTQNKALSSSNIWPTSYANATYGGPTDLWGETWTPAQINDTDFGAVVSVFSDAGVGFGNVDSMTLTVYCTPYDRLGGITNLT